MTRKITSRTNSFRTAVLGLAALGLSIGAAQAQTVYGLSTTSTTTASLVTFNVTTPGTFTATLPITGVTAGQTLVGIDVRPNTGEVFALGYNPTGTLAQLYTISRTTGVATAIGTALTLNLGSDIARIGFDFNPTVDRIRVTAGNRANFRLNPNNGALAATDGSLGYAAGDANAGQFPGVGSSAYTNSYIGSTATTLYNLDETASRLVTQIPPNDGILNTVGALGVATNGALQASDLDIYFNPSNGTNVAYMSTTIATGTTAATSTLYTVNLTTGAATSVGALGTGPFVAITDIALAIDRPATLPAITGQLAYALAGTNLITFDTAQPTLIRTSLGLTGVAATQTLVGLDVRPLTNTLYALGYNAAAAAGTANAQVYSVNAATGVANPIGAAITLDLGTGVTGFDFNPTVDRIRVVGANRNNYRLNPITGALAATDGQVAYTTGTNTPNIGAVAYTNSFMGAGSTSTTMLYNYDLTLNQLNTQATANPPADGQLTAVGSSGITVNATTPNVDLDIFSPAQGTNTAYMVANTGTSANTSLYTVNLTTGAATAVGAIGNGIAARNIAVAVATGVVNSNRQAELATNLSLYPNPLAGVARVSFGLPRASRVELTVTDALGRTIDRVDAGLRAAGPQIVEWNRKGQTAGIYFFRLSFNGEPAGTRQAIITE
ncbi:DUF4394 domain-containing protein [Hymenobacter sp. BT186]|uniref:DUF4394 domain-containing protein n=1 Tax=Hymenobacter telluris TaxID=2816474 RepID=A0A939EZL7_9BACT|nr:DUF4394 domain-containing protein [Hymenobacter telluris]MBO0358778.1 DUF4394 domain-containing protein [Hymenobacter telluris]MBW3374804.1 DUF4394 domain-containing protein [Hymenobacter norwichensis]